MIEKYSRNDLILLVLFSYAGRHSNNMLEQAQRLALQPPTFSERHNAEKIVDFIVNRKNTVEDFQEFSKNLSAYTMLFSCRITFTAKDGSDETIHMYTDEDTDEVLKAIISFCKSNGIFWNYPSNTSQADAAALKLITRFKQEQLFV